MPDPSIHAGGLHEATFISEINLPAKTILSPRATARPPKNPRALAGRLRRAQTFLRVLGAKIIQDTLHARKTVSTVSSIGEVGRSSPTGRAGPRLSPCSRGRRLRRVGAPKGFLPGRQPKSV